MSFKFYFLVCNENSIEIKLQRGSRLFFRRHVGNVRDLLVYRKVRQLDLSTFLFRMRVDSAGLFTCYDSLCDQTMHICYIELSRYGSLNFSIKMQNVERSG